MKGGERGVAASTSADAAGRDGRMLEGLRQLAAAGAIEVRIAGGCMAPHLADGGTVRVRPARHYWPGDVVVVRSAEGRLLAHRLLGLRPWRGGLAWVTQGDACAAPDTPVRKSAILGRVEGERPSILDRLRAMGRLARRLSRRDSPGR